MYSSFQLDALSLPLDKNLLHLPMVEFLGAPPWLRLFFCAGMRVCRKAQGSARAALPTEDCWLKEALLGFILSTLFDFQSHQGNS